MLYRTRPPQPPRLLLRIAVTATVSSFAVMACFGEPASSTSDDDGGTGVYGGSSGTSSGMPSGASSSGSSTGSSCGGTFCNGGFNGLIDAGGLFAFPDDASLEAAADVTTDAADSASVEDASSDAAPE